MKETTPFWRKDSGIAFITLDKDSLKTGMAYVMLEEIDYFLTVEVFLISLIFKK